MEAGDGEEFLQIMICTPSAQEKQSTHNAGSGQLGCIEEMSANTDAMPAFESGQLGVCSVSTKPIFGDFDVVLMDHHMPRMNGSEATRAIRERGYTGLIVGLTGVCISFFLCLFLSPLISRFVAAPLLMFFS